MNGIEILDERLANKIAAGEVVERPASVVKELVENALDAKADRITVHLEEGGIRSIRVADNGHGMDCLNAQKAFQRHATSKIKKEKDLYEIQTLGFRGEALPSIASVSKMKLTTSSGENALGFQIWMEGGKVVRQGEISCSRGTEVEVNDLFFHTPARLKHLKTTSTEVGHIADGLGRLALAYPSVAFTLKHQGNPLFQTRGDGKLLHVIHGLYGKQTSRKMVHFEGEDADYQVQGFLSLPEVSRANRSYMTLMINGRVIRSIPLTQAILKGYDTLLLSGRYPIVVIHVKMEPSLVDVNVHPAKLEVRLSKQKELCHLLTHKIRKSFQKKQLIPQGGQIKEYPEKRGFQATLPFSSSPPLSLEKPVSRPLPSTPVLIKEESFDYPQREILKEELLFLKDEENKEETPPSAFPHLEPLAQIHGTYVIAQSDDGFYLIDQHAAHERIYYEVFLAKLKEEQKEYQSLLIPLTMEFTYQEAIWIGESRDLFQSLGVKLEPFGNQSFLVRSCPIWFLKGSEEDFLREMVHYIQNHQKVDPVLLQDGCAKMMACKAAIKANQFLKKEEMAFLMEKLASCQLPYTCPHGRPTLVRFSSYDLQKMFKRVM